MEDSDLKKSFQKAIYHPEPRLSGDIWLSISKKEQKIHSLKLWVYSSIGVLSLVGFVPVVINLVTRFVESGFSDYFSVIFSDIDSISFYWKDLLLSLVDSIPMTSLIISFSLIFVFFYSLKNMIYQFRSKLLIA